MRNGFCVVWGSGFADTVETRTRGEATMAIETHQRRFTLFVITITTKDTHSGVGVNRTQR